MTTKFSVGEVVEVRDTDKEAWLKATLTQVNPIKAILDGGKGSFQWNQCRKFTEGQGGRVDLGLGIDLEHQLKLQQASDEERMADPLGKNPYKLSYWKPEDEQFWNTWGKKIAVRNMLISTLALFISFGIWTQWGGLAKQIIAANKKDPNVYSFGYSNTKDRKAAIGLLGPIAGISGGTQRVVHTWSVNPCGGRTATYMGMVLVFIPMFLAAITLMNSNPSLWFLYLMAIMSGIGGGTFSSIMSNQSFLFPDRWQGSALGWVGGFGNLGVSIQAQIVPRLSGVAMCFASGTSTCALLHMGGKAIWNPLLIWALLSAVTAAISYFYMSDMPQHGVPEDAVQDTGPIVIEGRRLKRCILYPLAFILRKLSRFYVSQAGCFLRIQGTGYLGCVCIAGLFILTNPVVAGQQAWVIVRAFFFAGLVCGLTNLALFVFNTGHVRQRLSLQIATGILQDRNTLYMTLLYIMTFASFIGYAGAFPNLIKSVFKGKDPAQYAWLGAFCGSFARVAGGFASDYFGGGKVTMLAMIVQVFSTIITGIIVRVAQSDSDPNKVFGAFVFFVVSLFTATGIGNASTFKQMATLAKDNPEKRGPLLGFTAAIAAYGAFVLPTIIAAGIAGGFLDVCFYVLSSYYLFCGGINYRFYVRENAPHPC